MAGGPEKPQNSALTVFAVFSNSIRADDWCTAYCDNGNLGSLSETGLHLSLLEMKKIADKVDNNDKQKEGSDKVSTEYGKLCWAYYYDKICYCNRSDLSTHIDSPYEPHPLQFRVY